MKKQLLLTILLAISVQPILSHKLKNPILEAADNAGLFDGPIVDILLVRKKVKDFMNGKSIWSGAQVSLQVANMDITIDILCRRLETVFGASFIVITPHHEHAHLFSVDPETGATGAFAIHPITEQPLPIFVVDYCPESYDIRHGQARLGIPAHDQYDFIFAKKHHLPIELVVSVPENIGDESSVHPIMSKNNRLLEAYTGEYDYCQVINSNFLNGLSLLQARLKMLTHLTDHHAATAVEQPLVYHIMNKSYSVKDLQAIEVATQEQGKSFSSEIEYQLFTAMSYAQSDFLDIVEQFLVNAKSSKELMIELIEESCTLHQKRNCYLLRWSRMNSQENERTIFKRDITTFNSFASFCTDLIDFLGDFANSCPHALEQLKKMKV